jgi:hypothetical protein
MSAVPACRSCGEPSPYGDPCEICAECERILALSDEEVLAECSPADLGWAKGFKEGLRIGLRSRVERGWLIEGTHMGDVLGTHWWSADLGFTADANRAVRFARKLDAQNFQREYRVKGTATEHEWPSDAIAKACGQ